jgi:hypothetical protein
MYGEYNMEPDYAQTYRENKSDEAIRTKMSMLEGLAKAFLDHTGLTPDRVELCQQTRGAEIVWYFRERIELPIVQSELTYRGVSFVGHITPAGTLAMHATPVTVPEPEEEADEEDDDGADTPIIVDA